MHQMSPLKPSLLLKVVLSLAAAIAIGIAVWLVYSGIRLGWGDQSLGNYATAFGILFILLLIGKPIIEQCSVTLTDQGIQQWCLLYEGNIVFKKTLPWSAVSSIGTKPGAVLLVGDLYSVEVNTTVFNSSKTVLEFISQRCPSGVEGQALQ